MQMESDWIHEGILPGPGETEEEYRLRAAYCLSLRTIFKEQVDVPFQDAMIQPVPVEGLDTIDALYGIRPEWIPLFYSNYRLPFWQGGCAWIFQQSETAPTSAFFQLRQHFRKEETYLNLYSREEVVAHELSHVGRMKYEEPRYEELLAYRTSTSPFRRYFGPLFTTAAQSGIFALSLLLLLMADLITLFYQPELYPAVQWLKLFPLAWLGWLIGDLVQRQRRFNACLQKLPEQVLYRLTDHEIDSFAKMDLSEIQAYGEKQTCLRWKGIQDLLGKGRKRVIAEVKS